MPGANSLGSSRTWRTHEQLIRHGCGDFDAVVDDGPAEAVGVLLRTGRLQGGDGGKPSQDIGHAIAKWLVWDGPLLRVVG
jgi:hypothetical protein